MKPDINCRGYVCVQHFEDDCFKHNKSKNRTELKPNSIPTKQKSSTLADDIGDIDLNANDDNLLQSNAVCAPPTPTAAITVDLRARDHCSGHISTSSSIDEVVDKLMWCAEFMLKDELIEQKDVEIKILRKKLQETQKKIGIWSLLSESLILLYRNLKISLSLMKSTLKPYPYTV